MPTRPLSGIRVVDLSVEKGELCGRVLSDLGAEVIRVEPPGGSPSRRMHPRVGDHSLFFTFRNAGKLGVVLDLDQPADRERLHDLLARSDVLIDSAEPGARRAGDPDGGLDADELGARHPHLVVCSITNYGRSGPYAGRDVPNAVIDATSGMAFKAGLAEREPLLPPGNIADDTASMHAAFAVLCALWQRHDTAAGQVIDLSVNEAAAQVTDWSLPNWSRSADAGMPSGDSRIGAGPVYTILPCKDGYVRLVIIAVRHWHAMRAWLGEPDYLQDPELDTFLGRMMIADAVLNPLYAEHFAELTMLEVAEECQRRGIVCTPVLKPDDVLVNPHFEARGSFDDVSLPNGATMKLASGFFEIDGERVGPSGPPPGIGEHQVLLDDLAAGRADPAAGRSGGAGARASEAGSADAAQAAAATAAGQGSGLPARARPLAGIKVMDFGHGGVGVEAGRMFADYGADVVKIESRSYFDFIRTVLGGEMSPSFASSSRSKRSLGVDAKTPEGTALLKTMARSADVVIENNSTGIMDSLGIGYGDLSAENPDLVMMSSQLMGSRGPWADWSGYGPNTQVTGGMTHLWNYEDADAPAGSMSIFPDHFAGRTGAVAALAGLLAKRRSAGSDAASGAASAASGMHIEICQVEQVVNVMADLLAKESLEPRSVRPRGNHHDRGVPWGLFAVSGDDDWIAVCIRSDAEWQALARLIGRDDLADDAALATLEGRRAREAELDAALAAWTSARTASEATEACLAAGVPAGPMLNAEGMTKDPHLAARGFLHARYQPPIGNMTFEGPAFAATAMLDPETRPAPGLGEHTREVAAELGLDDARIDELIAAGVLEIDTQA